MILWIIAGLFIFLYLYGSFMEGYNKFDAPEQLRKQTKLKQEELALLKHKHAQNQASELEIMKLKKEIEELKLKNKV